MFTDYDYNGGRRVVRSGIARSPGVTEQSAEDLATGVWWILRCPRTFKPLERVKLSETPANSEVLHMLRVLERIEPAHRCWCSISAGTGRIDVHHPQWDDLLVITREGSPAEASFT